MMKGLDFARDWLALQHPLGSISTEGTQGR
jgi:hypothetical protein